MHLKISQKGRPVNLTIVGLNQCQWQRRLVTDLFKPRVEALVKAGHVSVTLCNYRRRSLLFFSLCSIIIQDEQNWKNRASGKQEIKFTYWISALIGWKISRCVRTYAHSLKFHSCISVIPVQATDATLFTASGSKHIMKLEQAFSSVITNRNACLNPSSVIFIYGIRFSERPTHLKLAIAHEWLAVCVQRTYEGGLKSFRPQHEDGSTRQWKLVNVVVHLLTVTH